MVIYQINGFKKRADYLNSLATGYRVPIEYGAPIGFVYVLAYVLGENEHFDGLLVKLEDFYV